MYFQQFTKQDRWSWHIKIKTNIIHQNNDGLLRREIAAKLTKNR